MKKITGMILLCVFFLFRPYQMQNSGMLYSGDDFSYMAHATSLSFFQFPSYAHEYFEIGTGVPMHSIGPALMAFPFVFTFSLVDRLCGNEIVTKRTHGTVCSSWAAFGFMFSSLFYLYLTCFLLYRCLGWFFSESISSLTVLLAVIVQGVPLFALRRPVFTHIYEIFLQSLLLFMLLKTLKFGYIFSYKRWRYWIESVVVGVLIGLIFLVRVNNAAVGFVWPIVLFLMYRRNISLMKIGGMVLLSYLMMGLMVLIFQDWPLLYNFHSLNNPGGYLNNDFVHKYLFHLNSPVFYVKRLWHVLFGIDWGLIFTAPFILFGFLSLGLIRKDKVFFPLVALLLPVLVNLYIILAFREQGAWYGYRYIIFTLIPILMYPLAAGLVQIQSKKIIFYSLLLLSIVPVLSMWCFEGNNSTLTLTVMEQGFGVMDWGNNTYQIEIYKMLFSQPVQFLIVLLKAGPCYLAYLFFSGLSKHMPTVLWEKYGPFQAITLVKTCIIYMLPLVMFMVLRNKPQGEKEN